MRQVLIALLLLAGCGGGGGTQIGGGNGTPVYHDCGNGWLVWMAGSASCPAADGSFQFPNGDPTTNHIDYVIRQVAPKVGMTLSWSISGALAFTATDQGSPGCNETPEIRPMFAAVVGPNPAGRWWWTAGQPLADGGGSFIIDDDPAHWSDVNGHPGTADPTFAKQFASRPVIGFTFGTPCRYGHGVAASGQATFSETGLQ